MLKLNYKLHTLNEHKRVTCNICDVLILYAQTYYKASTKFGDVFKCNDCCNNRSNLNNLKELKNL